MLVTRKTKLYVRKVTPSGWCLYLTEDAPPRDYVAMVVTKGGLYRATVYYKDKGTNLGKWLSLRGAVKDAKRALTGLDI